jgi:Cu(I)/Ag(I) efflux system membrane fusion protein
MIKAGTRSIAFALLMIVGATLHASDAMKAIADSYLEIQSRLAGDSMVGVKPAAQALGLRAAGMAAQGAAIVKAAKALEQAADLNGAREAFGGLSDAVIAAGDAEGWKDVPNLRVAYCPMGQKSWIQKDGPIRNPYYGAAMVSCGGFKKKG